MLYIERNSKFYLAFFLEKFFYSFSSMLLYHEQNVSIFVLHKFWSRYLSEIKQQDKTIGWRPVSIWLNKVYSVVSKLALIIQRNLCQHLLKTQLQILQFKYWLSFFDMFATNFFLHLQHWQVEKFYQCFILIRL